MNRLIWLQVGIGTVVVVVIGVLSSLLVRSSLRPLRRVEETAHAIAGGDLHQRVPEGPENTEVGSLGRSINAMMTQIQESFAATARSEQQARESESMMRRFVADASHELRTPLTSIKGFAELLSMGAADPEDAVRRIGAEADRMNLLVEDLLMLARLDARRPLNRGPVEVVTLVADAVEAARAAAPEADLTLDVPPATGDPVISGDPSRLTQVIRNLVGNAVAHAGSDAHITVRVDAGPHEVAVTVADDGPGMGADDAAHVFERFYRGDDSATGRGTVQATDSACRSWLRSWRRTVVGSASTPRLGRERVSGSSSSYRRRRIRLRREHRVRRGIGRDVCRRPRLSPCLRFSRTSSTETCRDDSSGRTERQSDS